MKAKWHCCRSDMGDGNAWQSSHERFVVCPQLKSTIFTKLARMPDCCMCSQQFTIKRVGSLDRQTQLLHLEASESGIASIHLDV
jgi:hypothetical protein